MGLRSLSLSITMDDQVVSRSFCLKDEDSYLSSEDLAEALANSIHKGFSEKPDIIHGMLITLLSKVNKAR